MAKIDDHRRKNIIDCEIQNLFMWVKKNVSKEVPLNMHLMDEVCYRLNAAYSYGFDDGWKQGVQAEVGDKIEPHKP